MQVQKGKKNIVLTGGHAATTAVAVVEEIKRQKKDWRLHWIGTTKAMEGVGAPSFESEVLPKAGVKFHGIVVGRLQRKFSVWTIPSLLKIPIGFFQSVSLLLRIKPVLILSFGGFASVPVTLAAWVLRVPVLIHEQTAAAGLANRLCAPFAKRVAVSRAESMKYFPEDKVTLTGNPILPRIAEVTSKKSLGETPTIYITGGSRGSQTVNNLIIEVLEKLLREFKLVHQVGRLDFKKVKNIRKNLPKDLKDRYEVFANKDQDEIPSLYQRADMVIARAGANTVSEITQVARPSILIPIPFSYEGEQQKNAEVLEKVGGALVLNQEEATGEKLLMLIEKVEKNWAGMVEALKGLSKKDKGAARALVALMEENAQ